MQEKRRYKRVIIKNSDVHRKVRLTTDVKILNISPVGASVSLDKRLNIGSEYTLRFQRKDAPVSLKCVVVWEKIAGLQTRAHGETVPMYEAGLRFGDVSMDDSDKIIDLIESDILSQGLRARLRGLRTRLRGLRVEVVEPEKAIVKNCHVMRIDMEGMLIETEQPLDVEGKLRMELTLPGSKQPVKFLASAAFSTGIPDINPKCYDTMIEFVEMSKEDKSRLKEFVDSL